MENAFEETLLYSTSVNLYGIQLEMEQNLSGLDWSNDVDHNLETVFTGNNTVLIFDMAGNYIPQGSFGSLGTLSGNDPIFFLSPPICADGNGMSIDCVLEDNGNDSHTLRVGQPTADIELNMTDVSLPVLNQYLLDINMTSFQSVAGFQFELIGLGTALIENITNVPTGFLFAQGVPASDVLVVMYDPTGNDSIPAGAHQLATIELTGLEFNAANEAEVCLTEAVFGDPDAISLTVNYPEGGAETQHCVTIPCFDENASGVCDEDETDTDTVQTIDLIAGWNWISLNVIPEDSSVNSILNDLAGGGVSIMSQNQGVSVFYSDYSVWGGSLSDFEVGKMYLLKVNATTTLEISGTPVDVASNSIDLIPGWNWIGQHHQCAAPTEDMLAPLGDNGVAIMSQNEGVSVFYSGEGYSLWAGSLLEMIPGKGYLLNVNNLVSDLDYPAGICEDDRSDLDDGTF